MHLPSTTRVLAPPHSMEQLRTALFSLFSAIVTRSQFEFLDVHHAVCGSDGRPIRLERLHSSLPSEWFEQEYEGDRLGRISLAFDFALKRRAMFFWSEIEALERQTIAQREMLARVRSAGIATIVSTPFFPSKSDILLISFASRTHSPDTVETRRFLQLIARSLHAVHTTLAELEVDPSELVRLSGRQIECLKWIARGKSSWAISKILGVTPFTVDYHIKTAMAKLGTSSRLVAVLRAIRCGILAIGE